METPKMLVLSRKKDQKIILKLEDGKEIELTVVKIDANKVRLGIDAEDSVKIMRSEIVHQSEKILC